MAVRVIKKSLAGSEDLLLGFGTEVQVRNDKNIEITKINASNIPYNKDTSISEFVNGTTTKKVDTLADLRSMTETFDTILVSGYHTKGDGAFGSNIFELDETLTTTNLNTEIGINGDVIYTEHDNQGTVIVVKNGNVNAVYKLRYSGAVNVKWFGAKGDGVTDDSTAVTTAHNFCNKIFFPDGAYLFNVTLTNFFNIEGESTEKTIFKAFDSSKDIFTNTFNPGWAYSTVTNVSFVGLNRSNIGFAFGNKIYQTNDQNVGRVSFKNVYFKGLDKGIYKRYGNIGVEYSNCWFDANNYGVYATGAQFSKPTSGLMHSGCDTYIKSSFSENYIAGTCYIDNSGGLGQFSFKDCVFQFNKGFGQFFSFSINLWFPVINDNTWYESNGYPGLNVDIDTLTGTQNLTPKDYSFSPNIVNKIRTSSNGLSLGTDIISHSALNTWGNERYAHTIVGGGSGTSKWSGIRFITEEEPTTTQSAIRCNLSATPSESHLWFYTNAKTSPSLVLKNDYLSVGSDAASYAPTTTQHSIWGTGAIGNPILNIGTRFSNKSVFYVADTGGQNVALSAFSLGKIGSTGRSINAAGTINASGADYAEYEYNNGITFAKGDIVGFKTDGTLTNKYSEAIRFAIKSTNPSYVGGDVWGNEDVIGKKPEYPIKKDDVVEKVTKEDGTIEDKIIEQGYTQEEWELILVDYENKLKEHEIRLETERQKVDRIAYSGKVPVNVYGAVAGQYIVAIEKDVEIDGLLVNKSEMTFSQYQDAIGRVNKILDDGRAEVAVIIH